MSGRAGERGAGTVLALALALGALTAALALGGYGAVLAARHRAQAAADLAALSGAAVLVDVGAAPAPALGQAVADACARARVTASRNGARLVGCLGDGNGSVSVEVAVAVRAGASSLGRALAAALPPAVGRARAGARR